ncbi:hypothetical protein IVB33_30155 [Bradyrhizobium sp. 24]|uniref:hypothetical protein n=1 Tax=unclassified Bradyrhizobium TaxID=2631580 RepID=UPI001FF7E2B6|nr:MULTISPECIES: hypothetical protein [unclassified Bradyrhizobium]MCK1303321.1 hypothetical protein [Bradyrhizobium sp. 37]MCK1381160.1 hypothetical protein [Bradyrhizobium sp. 24]MCK1772333.1 hypothetical protein [Bradyrhizobium sp. 134]
MKSYFLLGLVSAGLSFSALSQATPLITDEEAKLPPPKGAVAADRRGIMRGPKVEFVSPGGSVSSPLQLVLKFESYGGAKIDPESVKVLFLRTPNVDLTARIKPFIQPDGINMQDAELPPGEYTVRVDIKDSDGRPGTTIFTLKVGPK